MRRALGLLALLLLAGCLTTRSSGLAVDAVAGPRLPTTAVEGLFLTRARIDGVEAGPFLIDTGSTEIVLDVQLAARWNLRPLGEAAIAGVARPAWYTRVASLGVGPVTLRDPRVFVVDLSPVTHRFGQRLAGILGQPFFSAAVVEVDYRALSVSCFDPATYRLGRGTWQPLTMRGGHVGITARLDGNAEGLFLLDTGSTHTVHLSADFVERSRLTAIHRTSKARVLRVDGEHDMMEGTIGWFELGGHRFAHPTISFGPPGSSMAGSDRFDGIIGTGLLRDFFVVFNYPGASIALVRAGRGASSYPSTIRLNASAWRSPARLPSRSAQDSRS